MPRTDDRDRTRRSIIRALTRNRGELDATALERLLRKADVELPPAEAPTRPREPYRRVA
jgi:hypothetical protein